MNTITRLTQSVCVLAVVLSPFAADQALAQDKIDFEACWKNLAKDEPESTIAILKLAQHPKETIKFLSNKLRPLILEKPELDKLMKQLGDSDKKIWMKAFAQLEYLDPRLCSDLESLMKKYDANPTRSRLVEILSDQKPGTFAGQSIVFRKTNQGSYNFASRGQSWWAESRVEQLNASPFQPKKNWRRATRAVILLEHFGSTESMKVLLKLSSGHEKAQPTREAKTAALRLKTKLKKR